jgi:Cytochrome c
MATGGLKRGEKVLFGVVGLLGVMAVVSFVVMEVIRAHMDHPMYANATHFDFSPEGLKGSSLFRYKGCSDCHRAVRNGTNMGLDLDGEGSRRSLAFLNDFLKNPEPTYASVTDGARTVDHGPDKAAAYVAKLPEADRHALAVFISELRANRGSADAPLPPKGKSSFIDAMVKEWAPDWWKADHKDVRQEVQPEQQTGQKTEESHSATGK